MGCGQFVTSRGIATKKTQQCACKRVFLLVPQHTKKAVAAQKFSPIFFNRVHLLHTILNLFLHVQ